MKTSLAAQDYSRLTPEERFRLILAASGRGDQAERDRLIQTGRRITLSMPDHAPYAHAFDELADLTFIILLEDAATYHDAFDRCHEEELEESEEAEGPDPEDEIIRDRDLDLLLAFGYILKANLEGWKLFCEKQNIPPFLHWEMLPGYERLQSALALAEKVAFTPEGFLKWLNRIRPVEEPELTELSLTADEMAKANEKVFQERVRWWGGRM
jgi:hypothetical protein